MRLDRTAFALALLLGASGVALAQEPPESAPPQAEDGAVEPLEEGVTEPDPMPTGEGVDSSEDAGEPADDGEGAGESGGESTGESGSESGDARDQAGPGTIDPNAEPNYGEVDLTAGFTPDPHTLSLLSGGEFEAYDLSSTTYCVGYIDDAPDYRVNYTSGDFPLHITATSSSDIALVVHTPDGEYLCDDDSAGNLNPRISITEPQSGAYAVWVATYGGPEYNEATLEISEIAPDDGWSDYGSGGTSGTVSGEIHLASGFKPDPIQVPVRAGGSVDAYTEGAANCYGYISEQPTFRIVFTAGVLPLTITAMSTADTTLMVRDSSGYTHCDDDAGGNLDAQVTIERTYDGPIEIWVGTYSGETASALLRISELE